MNFFNLGIIYTILGIRNLKANLFTQKSVETLPTGRWCFSDQNDI